MGEDDPITRGECSKRHSRIRSWLMWILGLSIPIGIAAALTAFSAYAAHDKDSAAAITEVKTRIEQGEEFDAKVDRKLDRIEKKQSEMSGDIKVIISKLEK